MKTNHCFLVDDDIDDQEIFCMALETIDRGIECSIAENGYAALERLNNETSFRPSYIFIDVNMPKMNGLDCLKAVKKIERLKESHVFMYSTSDDEHVIRACKQLGADDFIVKPASLDSLITILKKILVCMTSSYYHEINLYIISLFI